MPPIRLLLSSLFLWYSVQAIAQPYFDNQYHVSESNGLSISIRRVSLERPQPRARILLLVHGGGSGAFSSFDFERHRNRSFADKLVSRGFIVYLMNIRGWENSTAPKYDTTDASLVAGSCQEAAIDIDAVVNFIREKEHIEKVNLFGWATGGHWASYYTTLHNDKVDQLIVLNTLYGVKAPWSLSKDFADPEDSDRYNTRIPVYRESSTQAVIASRLNAVPFPDKTPWLDSAAVADYAAFATSWNDQHTLRVPGGYRRESFNMAHGYQYWNAAAIKRPTLIIRSQYDFWSRPIDVTAFYNDLTNAPRRDTFELPNATHFVFLDRPDHGRDALVSAIDAFIPLPPKSSHSIDSLHTDNQVLDFIHHFEGIYSLISIVPPKPPFPPQHDSMLRKRFGAKAWEKADFDGNGMTDLLVNGYRDDDEDNKQCSRTTLLVLSFGNDSFRIINLDFNKGFVLDYLVGRKIIWQGKPTLVIYQRKQQRASWTEQETTDTLKYFMGDFIERTRFRPASPLHELEYRTPGTMSTQGFSLKIRQNHVTIDMDSFAIKPVLDGGRYVATLDTATVNHLYSLLAAIDFQSLPDNFEVPWSDDISADLYIHYRGKATKHISDYGVIGTFGLAAVHKLLLDLPHSQHWIPVKALPQQPIQTPRDLRPL